MRAKDHTDGENEKPDLDLVAPAEEKKKIPKTHLCLAWWWKTHLRISRTYNTGGRSSAAFANSDEVIRVEEGIRFE